MTDRSVADAAYALGDRYALDQGTVFMSGVQALARIPLQQLRADRRAGLRTAAFASGYPGSPLAGYDREVTAVARVAADDGLPLVHRPGQNEELAATAVMGTQLARGMSTSSYDGVIGVWYGKAPGLDRASDAIRHGVFAGTSRHGGAVALVGDDPLGKSSTLPSSSNLVLTGLRLPVLYPGDVQEAVDLGVHAIALSRISGSWVAMKAVTAVADGSGTVELDPRPPAPVMPETDFVPSPSAQLIAPYNLEIEAELLETRLDIAMRYGSANQLNRVTVDPPDAWMGVVAAGYTYHELMEAFRLLDVIPADVGVRVLQVRQPYPIDPAVLRSFARDLTEVFVVEEKDPVLEATLKEAFYPLAERPVVVGKRNEDGAPLLPLGGMVTADTIVRPLHERLMRRVGEQRLRRPPPPSRERALIPVVPAGEARSPYYCSGCPHNWGSKVPDETIVGAGIGCSGMIAIMDVERVGERGGIGAMGTEGAAWVGIEPFVDLEHFTQNMGDGTFFHSGQLALQFAIASGVDMTYKLLFNGTIAMTGGQDATAAIGIPAICRILVDQGVAGLIVTADDVGRYDGVEMPAGVEVWRRERIVEAQERLREIPGVTVLIHDQHCAAELRRARRRGKRPTPSRRVIINSRVCEGCGDCADVSGCLSVQPIETEFGRKTRIDQTSCNFDYSCLGGDCPAFVTVEPGDQGPGPVTGPPGVSELPTPTPIVPVESFTVRMPGIGGTGVVTISQLLATAAMLDGKKVRGLDQTGLSQKAGPVVSDVRISSMDEPPASNHAPEAGVDLYLAFDLLTAASDQHLGGISPDRTVAIGSLSDTPTGSMVLHPERSRTSLDVLRAAIDDASRIEHNRWVDAAAVCTGLFGDAITANVFLLGVAFQTGAVPVAAGAIEEAIGLNGVAVDRNVAAFGWGRQWSLDPSSVETAAGLSAPATTTAQALDLPAGLERRVRAVAGRTGLGGVVDFRVADLIDYQSARYASEYLAFVARVAEAEADVADGEWPLTGAVAVNLHKLMAYKDEYEVARLLLLPQAEAEIAAVGGKGARATWHLHPPTLKALGVDHKVGLGRWARPALVALRAGKRLRGSRLDPLGATSLRRLERELPREYEAAIESVLAGLDAENHADAVAIAQLPDMVRGYENLKRIRAGEYRAELARLVGEFRSSPL